MRTLNCTENRHKRTCGLVSGRPAAKLPLITVTIGRVGSLRQGQREHRVRLRHLHVPNAGFPHQFQAVRLQRYGVDGLLVAVGSLGLLGLRERELAEPPAEAGRTVAVLPGEAHSSIQTCERTHNCRQTHRAEAHKETFYFQTHIKSLIEVIYSLLCISRKCLQMVFTLKHVQG